MLTKLPILSMTTSQPLWLDDGTAGPYPNDSIFRGDYRGHVHASRQYGKGRLTAPSSKPKVSAYLSRVNLGPEKGPGRYPPRLEPVQLNRYWTRRGNIAKETGEMEKSTSYKDEYTEKEIDIRQRYQCRHEPLTSEEAFNSKSTYKSDFLAHPSPRRDAGGDVGGPAPVFWPKPDTSLLAWHEDQQTKPTALSQPITTTASDPDSLVARRMRRPFATETSYRVQYPAYENQRRENPILPISMIQNFTQAFDGTTNYRDNFTAKELPSEGRAANRHLTSMGYTNRPQVPMPTKPASGGEWYECERLMPYLEHDKSCFYVAHNPAE